MGKIFCLIGKSSTGKDTLYQQIMSSGQLPLQKLIPYTTRPIRDGETDGIEYYFTSEDRLEQLMHQNQIIELRSYHTIHGIWKYFTVKDHQVDLKKNNYLVIGTLESFQKMSNYFGKQLVIPIYIVVEDGLRLQRALTREQQQQTPKYMELCRRFIADEADFSEEKLKNAGISFTVDNFDSLDAQKKIIDYISGFISS